MAAQLANGRTSTLKQSDTDGHFRRQAAQFRSHISPDPTAPFPAARDRYVLYVSAGCPWAHRTRIIRLLKGLDDIIQLVTCGFTLTEAGWTFDGDGGSDKVDPLYGFTHIRQLYQKADPEYAARFTVPVLWDKERETIVNNESSEIIRMFYTAFDALLPAERREDTRPLLPRSQLAEIEEMNEWMYDRINNGVYKTGFASTQAAYEENVYPLFEALDRVERHLAERGTRYLFGDHVTEADVRLYPTIVRFDAAYHTIFKCNIKMIRHDYPKIHDWLRRLYWDKSDETNGGAFGRTTNFDVYAKGYARARRWDVVPIGPKPDILPLEEAE